MSENIKIGVSGNTPLTPEEKYGKIVIVGRTQAGKTSIANKIAEMTGLTVLKTCTDRPRRTPNEDTYHFYTPEEAALIPDSRKLFLTRALDEYSRWCDRADFLDAGIAILDPTAVQQAVLLWQSQGVRVTVLYCRADRNERLDRWMGSFGTSDAIDDIAEKFNSRENTEAPMFDNIEKYINASVVTGDPLEEKPVFGGADHVLVVKTSTYDGIDEKLSNFFTKLAAGALPAGGFRSYKSREDLIFEPEDWTESEWALICRILGIVPGTTVRAVIKSPSVEYYSSPYDKNKYKEDASDE